MQPPLTPVEVLNLLAVFNLSAASQFVLISGTGK